MRLIRLTDESGRLAADIAPDYGGMPVFIGMPGGPNILRVDEELLGTAPMLAGGMPVLFPFASRTAGDSYRFGGGTYRMPFHGLVKNAAFAVKEASASAATVWIDASRSQKSQHYPFDFRLELSYRIEGGAFEAEASIINLSKERMPHSFGWHPFFLATDKRVLSFAHHMRRRYDCLARAESAAPPRMELWRSWDDVLVSPERREFALENTVDGYAVRCRFDDGHHALTVCTTLDRCVCIEPWCGAPDAANSGYLLQWVEAGATARYRIRLDVSRP